MENVRDFKSCGRWVHSLSVWLHRRCRMFLIIHNLWICVRFGFILSALLIALLVYVAFYCFDRSSFEAPTNVSSSLAQILKTLRCFTCSKLAKYNLQDAALFINIKSDFRVVKCLLKIKFVDLYIFFHFLKNPAPMTPGLIFKVRSYRCISSQIKNYLLGWLAYQSSLHVCSWSAGLQQLNAR